MKDFPSHLFVSIEDIRIDDINPTVIGLAVFEFNALLLDGYLLMAKEPRHPAIEYCYTTEYFNDWIQEVFLKHHVPSTLRSSGLE
jgi:hypothetical protein